MGNKYVSDLISLERDINPNKVNVILAGVGSGKNYWAQSICKMEKDEIHSRYNVLFITSRAITANVQKGKAANYGHSD